MEWDAGTHNMVVENCAINYGTIGIVGWDANGAAIVGSEFNGGVPQTLFWTDVKNKEEVGWDAQPEFNSMALASPSNSRVSGNLFRNGFDGLAIVRPKNPAVGQENIAVSNNTFIHINDDGINLSLSANNVEIDHNLFWHVNSGISLFEHSGSAGEVYIHHNIFDGTALNRIGRPGNLRERAYVPYTGGNPFGGHSGKSEAHWKVYNNTLISYQGRTAGHTMGAGAVLGNTGKYFWNNIFYALDDRVILNNDQEASGSHYDGNVFWQGKPGVMFANFRDGRNYGSLAELQSSGTSWEYNGLQIDPGFSTSLLTEPTFDPVNQWKRYIPTNTQVFSGGASYDGLSWPGTTGVSYRGAIGPDATFPSIP
jgi:hypothetical protein